MSPPATTNSREPYMAREKGSAILGLVGLTSRAMLVALGTTSCSSSSRFSTFKLGHARDVAAGSVQAGDKSNLDRVGRCGEDDRKRRGLGLCRERRRRPSRDNQGHLTSNQLRRQGAQSIASPLSPAIFDLDFLALDVSCLFQRLMERGQTPRVRLRRCAAEKSDHRHPRLLRTCPERPRGCAAEQRDECAPPHSITSSARASSVGGTSSPSALAVLTLMTRSNLVGCSTGMSPGFAPRRILSTMPATRGPAGSVHRTSDRPLRRTPVGRTSSAIARPPPRC